MTAPADKPKGPPVRGRETVERLAGALRACAREDSTVRFTGRWAHLGTCTVGQILDDASALIDTLDPAPSGSGPTGASLGGGA